MKKIKMVLALYYCSLSPPSRAVLMTCKMLGLNPEIREIDLLTRQHRKPEFLKVNPQHTLPTLIDGDLTLWESGAIAAYLCNVYGKDDSLYPKDPKRRAVVDQRLHFASGTFFTRMRIMALPVLIQGQKQVDPEKRTDFEEALGWLNTFLEGQSYVAGNNLTIADINIIASFSSIAALNWDFSAYPNVLAWFERCKRNIPSYNEANQPGANVFASAMKAVKL